MLLLVQGKLTLMETHRILFLSHDEVDFNSRAVMWRVICSGAIGDPAQQLRNGVESGKGGCAVMDWEVKAFLGRTLDAIMANYNSKYSSAVFALRCLSSAFG